MIKKMLFLTIALFSVFQVIAKTTPGRDTIDSEPHTWNVDLFEELKPQIPSIESREVYYVAVKNHGYFGLKKNEFQSTDKAIVVTRHSNNKATIQPEGQLAKPKDIVEISYNQKLQVYVPFANKTFWISASRGKKLKVSEEEIPSQQASFYQKIREARKEINFKALENSTESRKEAEESTDVGTQ